MVKHIADRVDAKTKDFSPLIEQARRCPAPTEIETGELVGGFAHHQVIALADKVVDAVQTGAIKRFFVMAGCDGRRKNRNYYTGFAEALPEDTVILTAGCAKYRYNKLDLGDIGGIPRVLDAGQCNDSYSLVVIALKLKEVFGLEDINQLPISYNIAWYEQKAVIVLLALLSLGVKALVGQAAIAYVEPGTVIGVGTGSTVNCFIDALGRMPVRIKGAVSSSQLSTARLQALGIEVLDANQVDALAVYIDGADEIDHSGCMVKGGGAALTREKIVADLSARFICIADESKLVTTLGRFPLPVEVIPMAAALVARRLRALGGEPALRAKPNHQAPTPGSDNSHH